MARTFDDASSQHLNVASAVVSAYPFTMACWFNSDDQAATQVLMSLADNTITTGRHRILLAGTAAGDPIQIGSNANTANTTSGYTAGTWHHAAGVWGSNTSRIVYIDGGNSASNAANTAVGSVNNFGIGRLTTSAPSQYFSGRIAEAAVWSAALGADEVLMLSKGYSPLLIRTESIVAYWPLIGRYSPEISIAGDTKFDLTVTGATVGDHCRIIQPKRRALTRTTAAVGGGGGLVTRKLLLGVGL